MEKRLDTEYQQHLQQKKHMMMKKKRKRRMKRRFVVFLFLIVCAGIILTALKAPFFDIKEIICQGQDKLNAEQITKIAGIVKGENVFSTSINDAEENLLKNPEIKSATVHRVFPNRIKIEIDEPIPVAYVEYGGIYLLINEDGKIITSTDNKEDELLENLVEVIGIEVVSGDAGKNLAAEDDGRALKLYDCLRYFDALGFRNKVDYVDFSDLSDIKLEYESRIYMLLGNYDSLEYKLKFVKKVIDEKIAKQERARFDFRTDQLHVSTREEPEVKENPVPDEENKDVSEVDKVPTEEGNEVQKPDENESEDATMEESSDAENVE